MKTKNNCEQQTSKPNRLKWYLRYDGIQVLTLVQVLLCTVIFLGAVCIKSLGGDLYKTVDEWYKTKINESLIAGDDIKNYTKLTSLENQNYIQNLCFTTPLSSPLSDGKITSNFGFREDPINNEKRFHGGLDIGATYHEPIYSVLSGDVEKSEENSSYGKYIIINHGNNISTLYAHCSELDVSVGQKIHRGDQIACVGSTGRSTGDHLHFEIRIGDEKFNPEPFLMGKYI